MKLELIKKSARSKKKVPRVDFNRRKKGGEQKVKGRWVVLGESGCE